MIVDEWLEQAPQIVRDISIQISALVADYEIILVDNCAPGEDKVYEAITAAGGTPNVQVFRLVEPVDLEVAAWAGVENSLGDFILIFDPLTESLESLVEALDAAVAGNDIVLIVNSAPERTLVVRGLRRIYRLLFRAMSGVDLAVEGAQFRLISKRVVTYLLQQTNPEAHYRALPARSGFSKVVIYYRAARTRRRVIRLSVDLRRASKLILSNSIAPLRLASTLAMLGAFVNVVYSVYIIVVTLSFSYVAPGWTTLSLQQSGMFFLFSLIIFVSTEYFIYNMRNTRGGQGYFIVNEMTSRILTRQERLNVEKEGIAETAE